MTAGPHEKTYRDLATIADRLFIQSNDNEEELATALDTVDEEVRRDLLRSDLLNAYQVFYYYFREFPGELAKERLLLLPASTLSHGVILAEINYVEVVFQVEQGSPVITLHDEGQVIANYHGKDAFRNARQFIDDSY
ncbi:MAG: hypothetical protein NTV68_09535 [Methanomicrobiales archaeon]|nr:hypothetical protein [Methanomicrobiales archaeon]